MNDTLYQWRTPTWYVSHDGGLSWDKITQRKLVNWCNKYLRKVAP